MPVNRVRRFLDSPAPDLMPRRPSAEPKTPIRTYLPQSLHEALLDYSELTGIPITRVVEDAVRRELIRVGHIEMRGEDEKPSKGGRR